MHYGYRSGQFRLGATDTASKSWRSIDPNKPQVRRQTVSPSELSPTTRCCSTWASPCAQDLSGARRSRQAARAASWSERSRCSADIGLFARTRRYVLNEANTGRGHREMGRDLDRLALVGAGIASTRGRWRGRHRSRRCRLPTICGAESGAAAARTRSAQKQARAASWPGHRASFRPSWAAGSCRHPASIRRSAAGRPAGGRRGSGCPRTRRRASMIARAPCHRGPSRLLWPRSSWQTARESSERQGCGSSFSTRQVLAGINHQPDAEGAPLAPSCSSASRMLPGRELGLEQRQPPYR